MKYEVFKEQKNKTQKKKKTVKGCFVEKYTRLMYTNKTIGNIF